MHSTLETAMCAVQVRGYYYYSNNGNHLHCPKGTGSEEYGRAMLLTGHELTPKDKSPSW